MRGLIIRTEPLEAILRGEKSWEIRGTRTNIRGRIALINAGAGQVVGTCEMIDCIGPLSVNKMRQSTSLHGIPRNYLLGGLPYPKTYAWVLKNPKRLKRPIPYKHKFGVVIWHPLPNATFFE